MPKKKKKKIDKGKIIKRQEAQQAIPPAVTVPPPGFIAEAVKKVEEAKVKAPAAKRDEIIAGGADSDFWKEVRQYIEGYQKNLKTSTTGIVQQGQFSLERIGISYLLADQIEAALQSVIDFVEIKRKTVELMKKAEIEKKKKEAEIEKKKGG